MAEVTHRSFDLKSWQGLTLVLKVARESALAPSAYAEFRNLVLEYAQQKGTDPELKKKIDAIIATFADEKREDVPPKIIPHANEVERLGRRVVPTFVPRATKVVVHTEESPAVPSAVLESTLSPLPVSEPVAPSIPLPPIAPPQAEVSEEVLPPHAGVKSVDEQRARIMEIKRLVNSQIENPIALMDHGNHIGREYMGALLGALKATNPGATFNLEGAMETLEDVFSRILARASHPYEDDVPQATPTPNEPLAPLLPQNHTPEPEQLPVSEVIIPVLESLPPMAQERDEVSETIPSVSPIPHDDSPIETNEDAEMKNQILELRKQLGAVEAPQPPVRTSRRSLIPSIVEMEEEPVPHRTRDEEPWNQNAHQEDIELRPSALTQRQDSPLTGITLETPQGELVSPEVTMALTELLHEWKIFASSGIFGMGPGGIEHPLYVRISRLPMGEVLSGRFDDADMKVVHAIKDYVDAWRHEQAVAYNPSETFEHYLRRVAQRIMKRQKGSV